MGELNRNHHIDRDSGGDLLARETCKGTFESDSRIIDNDTDFFAVNDAAEDANRIRFGQVKNHTPSELGNRIGEPTIDPYHMNAVLGQQRGERLPDSTARARD